MYAFDFDKYTTLEKTRTVLSQRNRAIKPSFIIFDIMSVRLPGCQKLVKLQMTA